MSESIKIEFENGSVIQVLNVNEGDIIRGKRRRRIIDWSDLNTVSDEEIEETIKPIMRQK